MEIPVISGLHGPEVTCADDSFFVTLFRGVLCLFLLEMGMSASRKLRDLKTAGWKFDLFGVLAPNLFELGTCVLFSVLCGAASYIAVPAV